MKAVDDCDLCRNGVLSLLSHELRNPLAALGNSLYVLKWSQPGGAKAQQAITTMERQIGKLSALISELTDAARINQGKVDLRREPVDVCQVVRDSVKDDEGLFVDGDIHVELHVSEEPLLIYADQARLAQAFRKLLDNAARFTPPGGRVMVTAECDRASQRACIRVADSGNGFDRDRLAHLFEPFSQGDTSLARTRGGLGLGLVLAKGLVELHGGSVRADSAGPGRGSIFTVELPLLPMANGQPVDVPAAR